MSQRLVIALAGGLTGLMLVVAAAVGFSLMSRTAASAQAQVAPVPAQVPAQAPAAGDTAVQAALSPDVAAQIALNVAPGASVTKTPELVSYNGTVAYEVLLDQGTVYVDANNGKVLSNSVQQTNGGFGQFGGRGGHEGSEHESGGFDD